MKRNGFFMGCFLLLVFSCVLSGCSNGVPQQPDEFVPAWAEKWTPPQAILDFEEKAALMESGGGRLLSMAHRGDHVYYPENSLEGILSCIAMGVDAAEVDVRITKDNVLVLSHDATVTRCTNAASARLKNPGKFPESDQIRDWTYEELRSLSLLDSYQKETEYRLPKLEDAVRACSGKMMILLDKMDEAAADAGMTEQELKERFLDPILKEYDSVPSCVKGWHFGTENMAVLGEYAPYQHEEIAQKRETEYRGKCVEASTLNWKMDREAVWADMDSAGVDLVMTNSPLALVQYIAQSIPNEN